MHLLRFGSQKPRTADSPEEVMKRINDDVGVMISRGRFMGDRLDFGPNFVHVMVSRGDSGEAGPAGEVLDLGWRKNLKTTVGMDWLHNTMGGLVMATQGGPATATSATAFSATGSPGWAANALAGYRVVFPVTGITTAPVYGNILSNATGATPSVGVDGWWNAADTTGTTPASTNAYIIIPGQGPSRYMAIGNDGTAPVAANTAMVSEITANACGRALATFAHTMGGSSQVHTLVKTWTASGAQSAQVGGLFTGGYGAAGGGILVAHTQFTSATLANGDSLQLTWTWTLPAAG